MGENPPSAFSQRKLDGIREWPIRVRWRCPTHTERDGRGIRGREEEERVRGKTGDRRRNEERASAGCGGRFWVFSGAKDSRRVRNRVSTRHSPPAGVLCRRLSAKERRARWQFPFRIKSRRGHRQIETSEPRKYHRHAWRRNRRRSVFGGREG